MFTNLERFPERLPMQYDLAGDVTRWADKSMGALLAVPLLQLFLTGLFLFINIVISKSKQQLVPDRPEESRFQNIIFRRRWSLFTIVCGTIMVTMFSLIQLSYVIPMNNTLLITAFMAVTLFITAGAFVLTLTTGQGVSRIQVVNGKGGKKITVTMTGIGNSTHFTSIPMIQRSLLKNGLAVAGRITLPVPFLGYS